MGGEDAARIPDATGSGARANCQGSAWKLAGFYPHARSAAGHDGLWYWTTARADAKAGKKWVAWVLYGEADQLLRPANFITTTHLDQLRSERHTNAPAELSEGISADTPLVIKAKDGSEFRFTALSAAATDDGKGLDLVLHYTSVKAAHLPVDCASPLINAAVT